VPKQFSGIVLISFVFSTVPSALLKSNQSSLAIELSSDKFYFKDVASAAEPCLVSGVVILSLGEATSLREVTLHLRGKARIPSLAVDAGYIPCYCGS
jgi:hypothetical protein